MKKIILSGICYAILSFGVIHGVKAQISDFEFGFSARVFKKGVKMTNFRPIYNRYQYEPLFYRNDCDL